MPAVPTYTRPDLPDGVKPFSLLSTDMKAQELTAKTRVICINRGTEPYVDKWDSRDYICPPGIFEVEYEAASHFRDRSVVPGSRNPITGEQEVFIAILGIDPPEKCVPFDQADLALQKTTVEALDRSDMDPVDRNVRVVPTSAMRARTAGGRKAARADIRVEKNASHEVAEGAMDPPVDGDAALAGRGHDVE